MCQSRYATAWALVVISAATGWGDIYRWDTGEIIPGTEGIYPGYGSSLSDKHLEYADFAGADLTRPYFVRVTVTGADFTDAVVTGGIFREMAGLTAEQLYNTATYQLGDLSGMRLNYNDLTGWNFAGKNLTEVRFDGSTLTEANFKDAAIEKAEFGSTTGFTAEQLYSTATYQQGDMSGMRLNYNDLTGWNFAGKNLTDGRFDAH